MRDALAVGGIAKALSDFAANAASLHILRADMKTTNWVAISEGERNALIRLKVLKQRARFP